MTHKSELMVKMDRFSILTKEVQEEAVVAPSRLPLRVCQVMVSSLLKEAMVPLAVEEVVQEEDSS
jgi:hypothetical protein